MQNTKYSANEKHQRVHQDPGRINYNYLKAMISVSVTDRGSATHNSAVMIVAVIRSQSVSGIGYRVRVTHSYREL